MLAVEQPSFERRRERSIEVCEHWAAAKVHGGGSPAEPQSSCKATCSGLRTTARRNLHERNGIVACRAEARRRDWRLAGELERDWRAASRLARRCRDGLLARRWRRGVVGR